jgi:integrase
MRPGELRALKWIDVDLDARVLHVRRTMTKDAEGHEIISEGTKRGAGRRVAIAAPLAALLRRHRIAQAERRLAHGPGWWDHGLVFDRGDGLWLKQNEARERLIVACRRADVPYVTAHGMRHTAASLLLAAGTPTKIVADMLGHASVTTTADIYQHSDTQMNQRAAADLAGLLFDPAANDE